MRDAQNTRDDDLMNVCFICGHDREVFEKEGISFDKHIKFEHDPRKYVYYLIYLRSKPEDEFDGIEEYVFRQYEKKKTTWIPIGETEYIKVEMDDEIDDKIDNIESARTSLENDTETLVKGMEKLKKEMQIVNKKIKAIEGNNKVIKKRTESLGDSNVIATGNAMAGLLGFKPDTSMKSGSSGKNIPKRGGLGGLLGKR